MSGSATLSPFFALPLELREEIYKGVLSAKGQGLHILRTCHEIHVEARKCLYQKPIIFRSQHVLSRWLKQAPRELLTHVSEISIHIQDVDLKPILAAGTSGLLRSTRPRLQTPEIYHSEVQKLGHSLMAMPNISTITIRALRTTTSFLYRDFITQFFDLLSVSCPGLTDLCLEGEFRHQELQFLSGFKRLKSFSFEGFSSSSPAATAQIFANLKQLRTLALVSEPAATNPSLQVLAESLPKIQSFTSEVMRAMSQLASFSVFEWAPSSRPNLFFTPEVLSSLGDHKTLKHLSVKLVYAPDTATLVSLEELLDKTSIKELELDWLDLDPSHLEQYDFLGSHLEDLWVRAKSEADASDILWAIFERRKAGELGELNRIVLVRAAKCKGIVQDRTCDRKDRATETEKVSLYLVTSFATAKGMLHPGAKDCCASLTCMTNSLL
jgi:hypothetical protein